MFRQPMSMNMMRSDEFHLPKGKKPRKKKKTLTVATYISSMFGNGGFVIFLVILMIFPILPFFINKPNNDITWFAGHKKGVQSLREQAQFTINRTHRLYRRIEQIAEAVRMAQIEKAKRQKAVEDSIVQISNRVERLQRHIENIDSKVTSPSFPESVYPLRNKWRILCWVMTDPAKLADTAIARELWVSKCDLGLYMASVANASFPTIGLDMPIGRAHTSMKSRKSWEYIYKHHLNDFDFFVKADPDTFIVVENLRDYLDKRDPNVSEYYGHGYHPPDWKFTYMAGGPGVVLSRAAVKDFNEKALQVEQNTDCIVDGLGEDWKVSKCLWLAGAKPVDTRDSWGRERFMVLDLTQLFSEKAPSWYKKRDVHGGPQGVHCCSDYPIGFHYVSGPKMYRLYYSIYRAKVWKISGTSSNR